MSCEHTHSAEVALPRSSSCSPSDACLARQHPPACVRSPRVATRMVILGPIFANHESFRALLLVVDSMLSRYRWIDAFALPPGQGTVAAPVWPTKKPSLRVDSSTEPALSELERGSLGSERRRETGVACIAQTAVTQRVGVQGPCDLGPFPKGKGRNVKMEYAIPANTRSADKQSRCCQYVISVRQ